MTITGKIIRRLIGALAWRAIRLELWAAGRWPTDDERFLNAFFGQRAELRDRDQP